MGSAILVALNGSDKKGSLPSFSRYPFPENAVSVFFLGALLFAVYLVGTFGSALSIIYAWNASNTSGHTKKGSASFDQIASVFIEFPSNDQRDDSGSFCSW